MKCDDCPHLYRRLQGIHERYEAALCSFAQREKWIASESDGMKEIPTPDWCPLISSRKEFKFMRDSKPLDTSPWKDPYE
jgi:hypothetical protein